MSGIVGVISKRDCREDLFYATDYHSHLGTQFAGLAVFGTEMKRKIHDISSSQFKSKFYEDYRNLPGTHGVGAISSQEEQPVCVSSRFGPFAVVSNGFIDNARELQEELFNEGQSFSEMAGGGVNHTELAAKIIARESSVADGVKAFFSRISGSCSLLILTPEGVYAARDRLGYSTLVIGKKEGSVAVTTESAALHNLGYAVVRDILPGEIVLATAEGVSVKKKGNASRCICSFLWIYTGFPASSYEGINTEMVRERSGGFLAKRDGGLKADLVAGIPDSGTSHAIGYAMQSKIPYRRILVKYTPGYGRSYTPPSQETRDRVARMKLVPVKEIARGTRCVICDDSIVRGTQLKNYTILKLKECGVKEIHMRIACPPLMFPCKFNYSTRSIEELAARRAIRALEGRDIDDVSAYLDEDSKEHGRMVEWIRAETGVSSLKYQKLRDMVAAIGLPQESLCQYCWNGKEPCQESPTRSRELTSVQPAASS